jgi:hypothetical protein
VQIVAVVLLHDEDVHAERVIRNIAAFCDRIHVADHMSNDGTWEIVSSLAEELPNVDATRISHAARSHDLVLPYVGTDTWVFGPDGDELFDPGGLRRLRVELEEGRYDGFFRLVPAMLHAVSLDPEAGTATGYLAPPARSGPKLYNFAAIDAWDRVYRQRLHEGEVSFRVGWHWEAVANLGEERDWDGSLFRCLHACFVPRSSLESTGGVVRLNIGEANTYRRDLRGRVDRALRRRSPASDSSWKLEKYRRGELVTVDASPFLGRG